MSYKPGDNFYSVFNISNISGVASNADSLPTGVLNRNGHDDFAHSVYFTSIDVGRYVASGVIPASYLTGDALYVCMSGYLGGNLIKNSFSLGILDSRRLSDINYWSVGEMNQLRYKVGIDGTAAPPVSGFGYIELSASGFENIVIEPGINARQATQINSAVLAGTVSGLNDTIWFQGINNPNQLRLASLAISGIRYTVNYLES